MPTKPKYKDGGEIKKLVNKATQGLSKGGSVKKGKALYTREGPCK
jgi:hypothetical protein